MQLGRAGFSYLPVSERVPAACSRLLLLWLLATLSAPLVLITFLGYPLVQGWEVRAVNPVLGQMIASHCPYHPWCFFPEDPGILSLHHILEHPFFIPTPKYHCCLNVLNQMTEPLNISLTSPPPSDCGYENTRAIV